MSAALRSRQDRQVDGHFGSLLWLAVDGPIAAQQAGSLPDPAQTVTFFRHAGRVKTYAPVLNIHMDAVVRVAQNNLGLLAVAVLLSVRERFLHDAENRAFQLRGQPGKPCRMFKGDLGIGCGQFLDQMLDGRHNTEFIQDRGPQFADQAASFLDRFL